MDVAETADRAHLRPLITTIGTLALAVGLGATATACGWWSPAQENRMTSRDNIVVRTDQATFDEALAFGGIVLPPSATVLGVRDVKGIDQLYVVAIRMPPEAVDTLLAASKFTKPLEKGRSVQHTLPGLEPGENADLVVAEDSLPPGEGRKQKVARHIMVDRTDKTQSTVHLWLFNT